MINREWLKTNWVRLILVLVLLAGVVAFVALGGLNLLDFQQLVGHKDALVAFAAEHPFGSAMGFLGCYLVLGFFGLPGNTVLYLSAGLLFGFGNGLTLVLVGSTAASSLAFFSFRYLFRSFVEGKVRKRFPDLENQIKDNDAFFIFTMRVLPGFPYSFINFVLALSPVRFIPYVAVSLIGLMPRYLLYVHAGTDLGNVKNPNDLVSPSLIAVLCALALLPWAAKWLVAKIGGK
jgi:uncharacterized membrane protein YdjX (TVP38/TMEM64 family)